MNMAAIMLMIGAFIQPVKTSDLSEIRMLYSKAPLVKSVAMQLNRRMLVIDSNDAPVLFCYKGANEMVQAKYLLNPLAKLGKFNRGKIWITQAVGRDTLDLEMRFVRLSVQSNLPLFLGYRDDMGRDKNFLLKHIGDCRDTELKNMIINYLSSPGTLVPEETKQLTN